MAPGSFMKEEAIFNLRRILEAAERILEFTSGMDYKEFSEDKLLRDGVIRNLEIMRQAVLLLDSNLRQHFAFVDWNLLINAGNGKPKDFSQFETDKIWVFVRYHVPDFSGQILRMIRELEK